MKLKAGDFFILLVYIGLLIFWLIPGLEAPKGSSLLYIHAEGTEWIYPLGEDREIVFSGPLGETRVVIANESAAIVESPCPNKTCITAGSIDQPGEWTGCLPNQVMIWIEMTEAPEVDVVSF